MTYRAPIAGDLLGFMFDRQSERFVVCFQPASPSHPPCSGGKYCATLFVSGRERALTLVSKLLGSDQAAEQFVEKVDRKERYGQRVLLSHVRHRWLIAAKQPE